MTAPKYCYEDMEIGTAIPIGTRTITADEIIEFAQQFDPAPFHLDEAAGKASFLGGLAASGWHVCSIGMKMICDAYILESSSQGSPGIGECKWLAPVLAGDTLTGEMVVENKRLSRSRPALGIVELRLNLYNQNGKLVLTHTNTGMMLTRGSYAA